MRRYFLALWSSWRQRSGWGNCIMKSKMKTRIRKRIKSKSKTAEVTALVSCS
jgi:hypothetical protein